MPSKVIGVIGAAGVVGREVVAALLRKDVEPEDVRFYGTQRTDGESLIMLAWHEAHHQGQIHLTWNLYKAAHGVA